MTRKIVGIWLILVLFALQVSSQTTQDKFAHLFTPAKKYVIPKTSKTVKIDGKANEKAWQNAPWSDEFRDIEGEGMPIPTWSTRYKMLWDDENLYIFAELEEPHIWAYYETHDMIVYHENDFEVFIDPNRDTHNYYEFEVNAQNTLFDLFMNKPYRNGGKADIKWNAKGFKSAIHLDGTLNDPSDIDEKWSVEMAIPFSSLSTNGSYEQPENGSIWKINFSRVQWQTDVTDGKYVKKKDEKTGKHLPENNWVWSPQGVINMHYPERWGLALFSSEKSPGTTEFETPLNEELSQHLWLLYYHQQEFRREYGVYAYELNKLKLPEIFEHKGKTYNLELKTDEKTFTAILKSDGKEIISINQFGLVKM